MSEKPARYEPDNVVDGEWGHEIRRSDKDFTVSIYEHIGGPDAEKAELLDVARRYNAHDALVEALRQTWDMIYAIMDPPADDVDFDEGDPERDYFAAEESSDAALALAKGEDHGKDV